MDSSAGENNVSPNPRYVPSKRSHEATEEGSEFNESQQSPNSKTIYDHNDRVEKHLEEIMLKKLELVYKEAISKLIGLGYEEELVMKAILRYGHCHGKKDALTNIFHNTLSYLNTPAKGRDGKSDYAKQVFANLSKLREFSVACLVCLVRRVNQKWSRTDAMRALLMCDLHVGRACEVQITIIDANGDGNNSNCVINKNETVNIGSIGVNPDPCRFHGGWGFSKGGTNDLPANHPLSNVDLGEIVLQDFKFPNMSKISPQKLMLMNSNVASFAAEYKAKLEKRQVQPQAGSTTVKTDNENEDIDSLSVKNEVGAEMLLKQFHDLKIGGDKESELKDQNNQMLLNLVNEITDLENQVKERKEWAHQKAMQAARKLSHDLTELKILKMEKDENHRIKMVGPTAEDPTMKKITEMESALRKASGQVDRANFMVRKLEVENAEIRAEMEASKLSAAESVTMCLAVAKREKKYLKKLLVWEKQRAKLQEDITAEKQKLIQLHEEMIQIEAAKKIAEAKWREEQKAKEQAQAQVETERRLKEATESTNKRNHETLRSKIELDFQRYKDDLQRLEQELSHIKTSTDPNPYGPQFQNETYASLLSGLDDDFGEKNEIDRACIICEKDEVSVVFLPCAHQVVCGGCSDEYWRKGNAKCPICRVLIEQRIRVFGASS